MHQLIRALGHLACGFVADAGCGVTVASTEVGEILMGIHSPQCTEHRAMISSAGPIWWGMRVDGSRFKGPRPLGVYVHCTGRWMMGTR